MTNIKDWLDGGRKLYLEVGELKEARQRAFELVTSASAKYGGDKVQKSGGNSNETNLTEYVCYCQRLEEAIENLLSYRAKIIELIEAQEDSVYKSVLIARYINCKTWEQIADDLNYNLRWVHRIHAKAIAQMEAEIDH